MYYGSGCINCPVKPCNTVYYRGSTCAAQRARLGLGDPMTNADRIRAMSDEELADFITNCGCYDHARDCRASCKDCTMDWLKQPVEDE